MTPLEPTSAQRAMRLGVADGALFALMVGLGETYFLANAVRLGASALELGWMVSVPLFLGALGPMLTLVGLRSFSRRKPWTVACALLQALVLFSIAELDRRGILTVSSLIGAACLYQISGMGAGTAWASWFGDLVPTADRGRYFASRSRWVHTLTLTGLVTAGLLLQWLEPAAAGRGFRLIFLLAAGCRCLSAGVLAATPEGLFSGLSEPKQIPRFLTTKRGETAGRLLLSAAALQLVTYLASPYFTPFMLDGLGFSYFEYMLATVSVVAGKFLFLPTWGRAIDGHGARPVFLLIVMMVACVPLPWLWASNVWWVIPAQLLSGITWSGYEVSFFSLALESSFRRTRAYVFAAQNLLNGSAQLAGATLGGLLFGALDGSFRLLFGVSLLARLGVALFSPKTLPQLEGASGRRDLALRIVGIRPSGGVVHRPIPAPGELEDDGDGF